MLPPRRLTDDWRHLWDRLVHQDDLLSMLRESQTQADSPSTALSHMLTTMLSSLWNATTDHHTRKIVASFLPVLKQLQTGELPLPYRLRMPHASLDVPSSEHLLALRHTVDVVLELAENWQSDATNTTLSDMQARKAEANGLWYLPQETLNLVAAKKMERLYWQVLQEAVYLAQEYFQPGIGTHGDEPPYEEEPPEAAYLWVATSELAKKSFADQSNLLALEEDLIRFWIGRTHTTEEIRFEQEAKSLLAEGKIHRIGYWHEAPYQDVYIAFEPVQLIHHHIPKGNEFLFLYREAGRRGHLLTAEHFADTEN